ncbi:MAG: hypothetical protein II697_02240, partial [Clostridia bacterium]|nr:hypothetical protein [Clostridia bacterium]
MKTLRTLGLALLLVILAASVGALAQQDDALALPTFTQAALEWDNDGNLIGETVHDLEGQPALNARGYYRAQYEWDDRGNLLKEAYFGLNDEAVDIDAGYAWAEYLYYTDPTGAMHIACEDRYASDGSRAKMPGSYSYRRDTWDGVQILSTEYFDADGDLVRPTGGFAQVLYEAKLDKATYTVTKRYLDSDGMPLAGAEGGATVVTAYTSKANLAGSEEEQSVESYTLMTSQEIYSVSGNAALGAGRWHRQVNTYDEKANLLRTEYYDVDGEPILASGGYFAVEHSYDELDRVVETDYFGIDNKLIKLLGGYAKVTYEYYEGSTRVHYETYFGADGERTMTLDAISMAEYEYDDAPNAPWNYRITYYDTVDEYTMNKDGFARVEYKYRDYLTRDQDGHELWTLYLDQVVFEKDYGTDL